MALLFLLLFVSFSTQAEIFQWVDDDNNTHFSDKPRQGATRLQVNAGHAYYHVKKVYDGDTILLTNGKKIRFLGINTPEIAKRNQLAEAGGETAKRWLINKLNNKKVYLVNDVEKKDKYGRLLAHVFTEDNLHLNVELVKQGLAAISIYPPNLKYVKALVSAQTYAERHRLGIWKDKDYAVKPVSQLDQYHLKGWQRIAGRVDNIHRARKYVYLNLSKSFGLKIAQTSEGLFPDLNSYLGQQIEARGWVNKQKNRHTMFIRHPSAIVKK